MKDGLPGFLDTGYLSVDFKDVVFIDICEVTGDFNELSRSMLG
jgi:hypothetical protein